MNDYYDYLDKRTATTPNIKPVMAEALKPRQSVETLEISQPMTVEESTASETIIERVKAYWRT
ncbi:MAG: hypothetical protein NVS9B2_14150 [Steroidobacteraceae bacterium]